MQTRFFHWIEQLAKRYLSLLQWPRVELCFSNGISFTGFEESSTDNFTLFRRRALSADDVAQAEAFPAVFQARIDKVIGSVERRWGKSEDCKDAVMEVLRLLLEKEDVRYQRKGSCKKDLESFLVNRALFMLRDWKKRKSSRTQQLDEGSWIPERNELSSCPFSIWLYANLEEALNIAGLSEPSKQLVRLLKTEKTIQEIAGELKISGTAANSRLSRARRRIKESEECLLEVAELV